MFGLASGLLECMSLNEALLLLYNFNWNNPCYFHAILKLFPCSPYLDYVLVGHDSLDYFKVFSNQPPFLVLKQDEEFRPSLRTKVTPPQMKQLKSPRQKGKLAHRWVLCLKLTLFRLVFLQNPKYVFTQVCLPDAHLLPELGNSFLVLS